MLLGCKNLQLELQGWDQVQRGAFAAAVLRGDGPGGAGAVRQHDLGAGGRAGW